MKNPGPHAMEMVVSSPSSASIVLSHGPAASVAVVYVNSGAIFHSPAAAPASASGIEQLAK
jgi:hypothetical protein